MCGSKCAWTLTAAHRRSSSTMLWPDVLRVTLFCNLCIRTRVTQLLCQPIKSLSVRHWLTLNQYLLFQHLGAHGPQMQTLITSHIKWLSSPQAHSEQGLPLKKRSVLVGARRADSWNTARLGLSKYNFRSQQSQNSSEDRIQMSPSVRVL